MAYACQVNNPEDYNALISKRFRGFLPVVVDVETAGFNDQTDALLEIAAVTVNLNENQDLVIAETFHVHVDPFEGANLDPKALAFNGIDPNHPFRNALPEKKALKEIFEPLRKIVKACNCNRAILVGHNAFFDLGFINQAAARTHYKKNPFHPFSTLDTVSLSALTYGQTVLAKSIEKAGIEWDHRQAHSALYDAEKTAELFCKIVNQNKIPLSED